MLSTLLDIGDGRLAATSAGGSFTWSDADAVAWALVTAGSGRLTVGDERVDVAERGDVFDEPGWSAVVPGGVALRGDGDLRVVIVSRPGTFDLGPARLVSPADVVVEARGEGACARTVRTYLPHGPIIAGETLNPPGGWSSYP